MYWQQQCYRYQWAKLLVLADTIEKKSFKNGYIVLQLYFKHHCDKIVFKVLLIKLTVIICVSKKIRAWNIEKEEQAKKTIFECSIFLLFINIVWKDTHIICFKLGRICWITIATVDRASIYPFEWRLTSLTILHLK